MRLTNKINVFFRFNDKLKSKKANPRLMKDIWKLSAIIKGCSVPFEKTLKFSENSSNFFKKVLKFFTKTMVFLGKLLVF